MAGYTLSKKQKLLERFKAQPSDFTWDEMCSLLKGLGFSVISGAGSRYKFFKEDSGLIISLHKPHPGKIVKHYAMKQVMEKLNEEGLL